MPPVTRRGVKTPLPSGARRDSDAIEPRLGVLELVEVGERVGRPPKGGERLVARGAGDRVAELLSEPVLAQFELEPEQPRDNVREPATPVASPLEPLAQLAEGRIQ